ncbi:DUF4389 domain-containing protein [Sanguibacter sp. 25GB23B1]|uniref:DUF4389 domain-containing protein n=1 Tax=unclassified Sanguibacter TaxID=2645534 RepID=UPI0032B00C91
MSTTAVFDPRPVHVDARLDEPLSRGLWLVKWLLALPHCVVLAFLWVAFGVTSVMAFFAILFAGRYPRALFDFNVGVLRWSWRVSFYTYGALGTDRYPPFSLHEVADYPAHLEIEYPLRLSRGLVLVKWWLLAIPHYLVLSLFLGGVGYAVQEGDRESFSGMGLIGLLVLVAAVVLLFTGRYPVRVFDLVIGLDRWVLRVVAYAALMTDRYPPFALDQGGLEQVVREQPGVDGSGVGGSGAASAPRPPSRHDAGWSPGRVVALVVGSVLVLTGLGMGGTAVALTVVDSGARDRDGFLMSDPRAFDSRTHAITSQSVRLHSDAPGDFLPGRLLGDARLTAAPADGAELFLGIGPTPDVERYLAEVDHETVTGFDDGKPEYGARPGSTTPDPPSGQTFWVVEDTGPGEVTITWELADGDWTAVLMNADGSAPVAAAVAAGAELPALDDAAVVLGVLSAVAVAAGVVLVVVPLRGVSTEHRARTITPGRKP